ncbi:MAG: spore maturation protein A [Oscillospiraceae bacterium]|nr:spore maturation protein A [Oscillospiraceae bacterium]
MFMSWFWGICVLISVSFAFFSGTGAETTAALLSGAGDAVELCVGLAGSLALWAGLGKLMERTGLTAVLAQLLSPVLGCLFPQSRTDPELAGHLSANVTANLLGLGNAATPMGIRAAGRLRDHNDPTRATDELCRLVVMNTASIQLLPTTVAALRRTAGCTNPFDILPCVWVSSILSVSAGLLTAWALGRVWRG